VTTPRFQILKFASIGVANTLLHGLVLGLLVDGLGCPVVWANLVAFGVANLLSYVLNSWITFKVPIAVVLYLKFLAASLLSLVLTLLLSWLAQRHGFNHWQGFMAVVVLVPMLSFAIIKFGVFTQRRG
jgi:putative flippase GtrA